MNAAKLLDKIKCHPNISSAGMILCHNGIVRSTSRDGRRVSAVEVTIDRERLANVISLIKRRTGIIEFLADIQDGRRLVGEDLMILVIAGDYRENVIPAMTEAIDVIKKNVVSKKEFFAE